MREALKSYDEDPGWYVDPSGSLADVASANELRRDGIDVNRKTTTAARKATLGAVGSGHHHGQPTPAPAGTTYTCPMHPEVLSDKPGKCPKCGMKLVPKR